MPMLTVADAKPRDFAEFLITKSWQEVGQHLRLLRGAQFVGFTTGSHAASLQFELTGYDFFVREAGRVFAFSVAGDCPDRLLHNVQSHFASLLSSHLDD